MFRLKTTLIFVAAFSAFFWLVFVIGCGDSAERQVMSDFLKLYSDTVQEYSAADESKKTELKGKLDSFKSKWSDMKMEHGGELTPQDLNKLDKEFEKITEKYASLAGNS